MRRRPLPVGSACDPALCWSRVNGESSSPGRDGIFVAGDDPLGRHSPVGTAWSGRGEDMPPLRGCRTALGTARATNIPPLRGLALGGSRSDSPACRCSWLRKPLSAHSPRLTAASGWASAAAKGLSASGRLLGQGSREAGGGQGRQISLVGGSGNLGSAVEVGDPAAQGVPSHRGVRAGFRRPIDHQVLGRMINGLRARFVGADGFVCMTPF